MRREIAAVVFFLKRLVAKKNALESEKIELFAEKLAVALQEKFKGHWYPENPSKGQAYRCIRVNRFHREDPELLRACKESGVQYGDLGLPLELTLWVDPGEVCCRYGENNPCFSVACYSCNDNRDEDLSKDKDVAKMVTSAVERVTSDYHSGSSSDEETSARISPRTILKTRCSSQAMNPRAPAWNPTARVYVLPRPHQGFRVPARAHPDGRQSAWVPPGRRGRPRHWELS